MLEAIRHAMEGLHQRLAKTLDMPPKTAAEVSGDPVDPALQPIEKELSEALASLKKMAENKDKAVHASELAAARQALGHVDSLFHEGRFVIPGAPEGEVPAGQAKLAQMLSDGHELLREILMNQVDYYKVGSALMPIHDKLENCLHALREIKNSPDELKPKQLRPYRSKLAEIDAHYEQARIEVANQVPEGQAVVAGMLSEAHDIVRECLMRTDYYKVAPELISVHDRLESIIFRLEGLLKKENVVEGDVSRLRDKLMAIDSEYEEAKMGAEGGKVPEGQAVISELLEKTHNLMNQVQNKL